MIVYTSALTDYVISKTAERDIVKEQLLPENENYDVLTGLSFTITEEIDPTDSFKAGYFTGVQRRNHYCGTCRRTYWNRRNAAA